ncbi:MAG TPA: C39 family peptidase [Thermomicrobiales bacterium]|nr:C39 family peptidase [Thermomicrobiales bacterium]
MTRWLAGPVVVAIVMAMMSAILAGTPVAASSRTVDAWVTVRSASPGVGCSIPVAIEVRAGGNPIEGVDVLGGLVVDGQVQSSDRAVTAADGIGFLDVASADAPATGKARIEVNLNGVYIGAVAVTLVPGGDCASTASVLSATATIGSQATTAPVTAAPETAPAPASTAGTGAMIPVPTYVQQRNLSCEYASLQIATGAYGSPVSEYNFDAPVGLAADPHVGYRGDITGWWGNTTDYGVYAEPLAAVLPQFGFRGETFYGVGNAAALTNRLDAGLPTLVWLGLWGDTGFYEYGADGSRYLLVPGAHVVVAYGYDQAGVYVSDPAVGASRFYSWDSFMAAWNVFDGMGLAVSPL